MTGICWLKSIAFVMVFCLLFGGASWFFRPGVSLGASRIHSEAPNTVDVLFVGSSRVYCAVNPNVLWLDEGIASFVFASSAQPLWTSYNYIIEALKTQKPSILVLDVVYAYRYFGNGYAQNQSYAYSILPLSANKLNMINSACSLTQNIDKC
jgi:hypothetical protein